MLVNLNSIEHYMLLFMFFYSLSHMMLILYLSSIYFDFYYHCLCLIYLYLIFTWLLHVNSLMWYLQKMLQSLLNFFLPHLFHSILFSFFISGPIPRQMSMSSLSDSILFYLIDLWNMSILILTHSLLIATIELFLSIYHIIVGIRTYHVIFHHYYDCWSSMRHFIGLLFYF